MKTATKVSPDSHTDARRTLLRRLKRFYQRFNEADWAACFALIDPELRGDDGLDFDIYARQMREFKGVYESINIRPRHTHIALLQLTPTPRQQDKRPFAYIHLFWHDGHNRFHMLRERWIEHEGKWYTRMAGLIASGGKSQSGERV